MPNQPDADPRRILVRGVNWLGDAVMSTSALLRLRERLPAARIALLLPAKLKELWQNHPAVNETIAFEPGEGPLTVGRRLRAGGFDLALVLPNSPRSALDVWLARIPRRVGYARPWRNWLLTQALPSRPESAKMHKRSLNEIRTLIAAPPTKNLKLKTKNSSAHQIHEYLHLAAALGANPEPVPPQLFVAPDELAAVRRKFQLDDLAQPVLALNAGAEYGPAKRWPLERFIAAAQAIQQRTHCTWLLLGGPADRPMADTLQSAIANRQSGSPTPQSAIGNPQSAIRNVAGQTSLRELCALLKLSRVLLTNDTGPMHVAAALGTPVVALFGSTSPELTGPGLPGDPRHHLIQSDAPCSPCFLRECPIDFRCMRDLGVDPVVEAVLKSF